MSSYSDMLLLKPGMSLFGITVFILTLHESGDNFPKFSG